MKIVIKYFLFLSISCVLVLGATDVNAQRVSKAGTTAAEFLKIGVGPRATGMGSAYVAVSDDATAMYWNPAGIAGIEKNEIFA